MTAVLAVDLGNESGRVMQVVFDGARITAAEIYRFPNNPVTVSGTLHWDVLRLWHEVQHGLARALHGSIAGIGVDSFGVDFALLDARDQLIANPVHMRDSRTDGMIAWVEERVPRQTLFERSGGIGIHPINTLYQLAALVRAAPWQIQAARTLLTMPNLFNFWLTGEKLSEFTHTTTTQCYNPLIGDWDRPTLETLGIPTAIFPPVIQPGTHLGHYQDVPVFAVASHDTASAVVAVPTETPHYAYISSGTWSLVGLETDQPLRSAAALEAGITSEGGAFGTFRPLMLVMGLWIIQQCRAAWEQQATHFDYVDLLTQAEAEAPFVAFINPDDPMFFAPGDMPARVRDFCARTDQPVPQTPGQIVRCVLESLALKYRIVLDQLAQVSGRRIDMIHIVGGGAQNALLCQMTANAAGRPVLAGPSEATSLGNGLVQLIALGELANVAQARAIIRASYPPALYAPHAGWESALERFKRLVST